MAGDYDVQPLGTVAKVRSGYAFKSEDMGAVGLPVIKIKNVVPPTVDITDCDRVPEEVISSIPRVERFELKEGDTLIAMTGATVGKVGKFPRTHERHFLNQRVGKVYLTEPDAADYRYIYYILSQDTYVRQMFGIADGSAQANISGSQIESLEVPLPPLAEQKAIAAVLGALDDKIELNRRMNATLEAMARALFQSWFVDFDPVRAKLDGRPPAALDPATAALFPDSFQDSLLGHIPQGWKSGKLGEFTQVGIGGAWGEEAANGKANVAVRCLRGIDCHDLAERKLPEVPIRHLSERQFADRKLKEGCILVEGSGSFCGRSMVWLSEFERLVGDSVCYSNFCKRLDPLCSPSQALVCWMQLRAANDTGELANFRTGTAFPNFDIHGALLGLDVVCPPEEICDRYMKLYRSWLRLDLVEESRTLATLRDTLLPKLLSGELSVAATDKESLSVQNPSKGG
jgi:type I restriction enzyme S subunit